MHSSDFLSHHQGWSMEMRQRRDFFVYYVKKTGIVLKVLSTQVLRIWSKQPKSKIYKIKFYSIKVHCCSRRELAGLYWEVDNWRHNREIQAISSGGSGRHINSWISRHKFWKSRWAENCVSNCVAIPIGLFWGHLYIYIYIYIMFTFRPYIQRLIRTLSVQRLSLELLGYDLYQGSFEGSKPRLWHILVYTNQNFSHTKNVFCLPKDWKTNELNLGWPWLYYWSTWCHISHIMSYYSSTWCHISLISFWKFLFFLFLNQQWKFVQILYPSSPTSSFIFLESNSKY